MRVAACLFANALTCGVGSGCDRERAAPADTRLVLETQATAPANPSPTAPNDASCVVSVVPGGLEGQAVPSLDAAFELMRGAHATREGTSLATIQLAPSPLDAVDLAASLRAMRASGALPDGGWQLWTSGNLAANHALISHAGRLFVFPDLSSGSLALCGLDGAALVSVGGGGARPWHVQQTLREYVRGYLCPTSDGNMGSCGDEGVLDAPTLGQCTWVSTHVTLTLLDPQSLRASRTITLTATPTDGQVAEPAPLLTLDWRSSEAVLHACGERRTVPYSTPCAAPQ